MQRSWKWRPVVMEEDSELFIEPIVTAAANVARPMLLQVDVRRMVETTPADPYDDHIPVDRILFEVDKAGACTRKDQQAENGLLGGTGPGGRHRTPSRRPCGT